MNSRGHHKSLKRICLLVILSFICIVSVSAPASAHSSSLQKTDTPAKTLYSIGCYQATCYHQDPVATNCYRNVAYAYKADARGVPVTDSHNQVIGYVQNVYSWDCVSNWGEATMTNYGMQQYYTVTMDVQTLNPTNEELCYPYDTCGDDNWRNGYNGNSGWPAASNMVNGVQKVQVCITFSRDSEVQYSACLTQ